MFIPKSIIFGFIDYYFYELSKIYFKIELINQICLFIIK